MTGCKFCSIARAEGRDYGTAVAFLDAYPVTTGHTLVIPRDHAERLFELSSLEVEQMFEAARAEQIRLQHEDPTITGFTVGFNDGESAGQTVPHTHLHVIPRRDGDTHDPRGGIRWVIPSKANYWQGATDLPSCMPWLGGADERVR